MSSKQVDSKPLHHFLRKIASYAVVSFFSRVHVIGGENVPQYGPLICTATHHNMMLDPAVLSSAFPHARILNYWSKASLFANPIVKWLLVNSGNIPVARKSNDRNVLFKGTIDALAQGWAVALFPEGTSYTEPRIMQIKDGAAWAALEYSKWALQNPGKASGKPLKLVPAALVYTNKSKYRSDVIMEFSGPISMDPYMEEFMSGTEGAARAAVKRLSSDIYTALLQTTINAPDWDTLFAARMARDLLWPSEHSINLDDFVAISQTLVDLFATPDATPNIVSVRRHLLSYYSLLQSTHLTNSVLSALPLPASLNPAQPVPLPSRVRTLAILVRDTLGAGVRLPFFLFPLLIHAPMYAMARYGAKLVEDEEETQAQNKVVFGFLLILMVYPAAFFFLWALLWFSPLGAVFAASVLYVFAMYHNRLINGAFIPYLQNYEQAKRLVATWRVLVGVWVPKRWDLSLQALSQYTIPLTPPENPWVEKNKEPAPSAPDPVLAPAPAPTPSSPSPGTPRKPRRPPTRRLIRHVLRARAQAANALASFFAQLDAREGEAWVRAAPHLARAHGGRVEGLPITATSEGVAMPGEPLEQGFRRAHEVLAFLLKRGAKIQGLEHGIEGDWAAALSSGADTPVEERTEDEMMWVASTSAKRS